MKNYQMYAELLKTTIDQNKDLTEDDIKELERQIKACEIADDEGGIAYALCDIGALNDIIQGYILIALEGHEEIIDSVLGNMRYVFDRVGAKEAEACYQKHSGASD